MTENKPLDYDLARAIQLAFASESAFGIDFLPRGERFSEEILVTAQENEPALPPSSSVVPQALPSTEEPQAQVEPQSLRSIAQEIAQCQACSLCESRSQTVPGQGHQSARLMFVGEAPGAEEDQSGEAFVGAAGQLLTKMIGAMGLSREDVFIANILKCRPPGNRNPEPQEVAACSSYLENQIDLIRPDIICTLGAQSTNHLLGKTVPIGQVRGQTFSYRGAKLVPTYHPAYLLRDPSKKRGAWEDLQRVMALLAGT